VKLSLAGWRDDSLSEVNRLGFFFTFAVENMQSELEFKNGSKLLKKRNPYEENEH